MTTITNLVSNMSGNSTQGFEGKSERCLIKADAQAGLEHLCDLRRDSIRTARPEAGIERIEARFRGDMFSPHRHDTYAIGVTLRGVQRFKYRGEERVSLPGQIMVLHPDEVHDGGAGTEEGLFYRMMYIPPNQILAALGDGGGWGLPFVKEPVLSDVRIRNSLLGALDDLEGSLGELKISCLLADLADSLSWHSDDRKKRPRLLDRSALRTSAEYLKENCSKKIAIGDLENVSGLDRFALARQFKMYFGTSPHRYLVMRRLDRAKETLSKGSGLADTAFSSGFSDQAHMTRHFKRAFGITPGKWQQMQTAI